MVEELKVVWSKTAQKALEDHYNYIKEESVQSAEKVKIEILGITKSLSKAPTCYPLDKYLKITMEILETLRNIV
jgi:plasmid stabilization system protein ParE